MKIPLPLLALLCLALLSTARLVEAKQLRRQFHLAQVRPATGIQDFRAFADRCLQSLAYDPSSNDLIYNDAASLSECGPSNYKDRVESFFHQSVTVRHRIQDSHSLDLADGLIISVQYDGCRNKCDPWELEYSERAEIRRDRRFGLGEGLGPVHDPPKSGSTSSAESSSVLTSNSLAGNASSASTFSPIASSNNRKAPTSTSPSILQNDTDSFGASNSSIPVSTSPLNTNLVFSTGTNDPTKTLSISTSSESSYTLFQDPSSSTSKANISQNSRTSGTPLTTMTSSIFSSSSEPSSTTSDTTSSLNALVKTTSTEISTRSNTHSSSRTRSRHHKQRTSTKTLSTQITATLLGVSSNSQKLTSTSTVGSVDTSTPTGTSTVSSSYASGTMSAVGTRVGTMTTSVSETVTAASNSTSVNTEIFVSSSLTSTSVSQFSTTITLNETSITTSMNTNDTTTAALGTLTSTLSSNQSSMDAGTSTSPTVSTTAISFVTPFSSSSTTPSVNSTVSLSSTSSASSILSSTSTYSVSSSSLSSTTTSFVPSSLSTKTSVVPSVTTPPLLIPTSTLSLPPVSTSIYHLENFVTGSMSTRNDVHDGCLNLLEVSPDWRLRFGTPDGINCGDASIAGRLRRYFGETSVGVSVAIEEEGQTVDVSVGNVDGSGTEWRFVYTPGEWISEGGNGGGATNAVDDGSGPTLGVGSVVQVATSLEGQKGQGLPSLYPNNLRPSPPNALESGTGSQNRTGWFLRSGMALGYVVLSLVFEIR